MTEKPAKPESTPVPVAETTEEISDVISKLETNKKTVIVAILLVSILICIVIVIREIKSQKHLAGAEAYSLAATTRSVEELDKVIAEFPGSIAAGNALLSKAELEITSDKSKDAQVTLLTFVEKYNNHPRHTQGLFAFGNLYQNAGESEKASKYYDRILKEDPDSELAPFALIRQGDLLLAAGKTDEARLKYESIMPAYRGTAFYKRVEEKLELLKVEKLPVVPEPKKPEPEKPVAEKKESKPDVKTVRELIDLPGDKKDKKPAKAPKKKEKAEKPAPASSSADKKADPPAAKD